MNQFSLNAASALLLTLLSWPILSHADEVTDSYLFEAPNPWALNVKLKQALYQKEALPKLAPFIFPSSGPYLSQMEIERLLSQRRIFEQQVEQAWNPSPQSKRHPYQSVLWTVVANIQSREVSFDKKSFREVALPVPKVLSSLSGEALPYYQKPVPFHYRPPSRAGAKLFVILSGSYATWSRGSYFMQLISQVDELEGGNGFFVMEGYLVPDFLKSAQPRQADLKGDYIARDLLQRIQAFVDTNTGAAKDFAATPQIGLIGLSGGASISLGMAAIAGERNNSLFSLGVIAFNPILDIPQACQTIDEGRNQALRCGNTNSLTTLYDFLRLALLMSSNLQENLVLNVLRPGFADDFTLNFYNEEIDVDLQKLIEKSNLPNLELLTKKNRAGQKVPYIKYSDHQGQLREEELNYTNFYGGYALEYEKSLKLKGVQNEAQKGFAAFSDARWMLPGLKVPTFILLPQDDPNLVATPWNGEALFTPGLQEIVNDFKAKENVTIFTPKYGAHMAYFLDRPFIKKLLAARFFRSE